MSRAFMHTPITYLCNLPNQLVIYTKPKLANLHISASSQSNWEFWSVYSPIASFATHPSPYFALPSHINSAVEH